MTTPDPTNPSGWKYRRRIVFCTLLYCAGIVGYVVGTRQDTELGRLIVMTFGGLASSTIAYYVFGAAWERTKGV